MTRTILLALAGAAALAGCSGNSQTVGGDEAANGAAEANATVTLPPPIVATKTYRCADNKIVSVDYLGDGKSANVRADKGAASVLVSAPEAGQPMTGEGGYSVEGTAESSTAKIALPGGSAQSCKA